MNPKYIWYAIAVTAVSTIMSWSSLFGSIKSSSFNRGGSTYSGGGGYYGGGGGGGHK